MLDIWTCWSIRLYSLIRLHWIPFPKFLRLGIHGIKVRIMKTELDPNATEVLQMSWVKIYGLPSIAHKEVIMKVATLARDPILVDELSLIKTGPVRVKMHCRDPATLRGFVKIFFNRVGYDIMFISEKYKDKMSFPPSPPDRKDDLGEDGDEDGEDSDEDDSDRKHKRYQSRILGSRVTLRGFQQVPILLTRGVDSIH
jgi:hypothetical protein